jgi:hypothetical protein
MVIYEPINLLPTKKVNTASKLRLCHRKMKVLCISALFAVSLSASSSDTSSTGILSLPTEVLELIFAQAAKMDPSLSAAEKWAPIRKVSHNFQNMIDEMVIRNFPGEIEVDKYLAKVVDKFKKVAETDRELTVKDLINEILNGFEQLEFAKLDPVAYSCKLLRLVLPIFNDKDNLSKAFSEYLGNDFKVWLMEKNVEVVTNLFSRNIVGKVMKVVKNFMPKYVQAFESIIREIFYMFQPIVWDTEVDKAKRTEIQKFLFDMLCDEELTFFIDRVLRMSMKL